MDRNSIHQIGEQQVKGEERRREKEVVDGVKIYVADGRDDEHQEEKEEQRNGRRIADFAGKGTRLQFLRHGHAGLKAGNEATVLPCELPSASDFELGDKVSSAKSISRKLVCMMSWKSVACPMPSASLYRQESRPWERYATCSFAVDCGGRVACATV